MTASTLGDVHALRVTRKTEVFFRLSRSRFQKLEFVVGLVRIVALDAVAHRRWMHRAFQVSGIFVSMTGDAERLRVAVISFIRVTSLLVRIS